MSCKFRSFRQAISVQSGTRFRLNPARRYGPKRGPPEKRFRAAGLVNCRCRSVIPRPREASEIDGAASYTSGGPLLQTLHAAAFYEHFKGTSLRNPQPVRRPSHDNLDAVVVSAAVFGRDAKKRQQLPETVDPCILRPDLKPPRRTPVPAARTTSPSPRSKVVDIIHRRSPLSVTVPS
jgi:hypothetical protein